MFNPVAIVGITHRNILFMAKRVNDQNTCLLATMQLPCMFRTGSLSAIANSSINLLLKAYNLLLPRDLAFK